MNQCGNHQVMDDMGFRSILPNVLQRDIRRLGTNSGCAQTDWRIISILTTIIYRIYYVWGIHELRIKNGFSC